MKAFFGFLFVLVLFAAGAHVATVAFFPSFAMNKAMERLTADGGRTNMIRHGGRTTSESRAVVRPAPDLTYSTCVFDLWRAPVQIRVSPSTSYWSLSLYSQSSDNFAVFNDRDYPEGVTVTLVRDGAAAPAGAAHVVHSPSRTGIALVRRLAPDAATFAAVDAARQGDACASLAP